MTSFKLQLETKVTILLSAFNVIEAGKKSFQQLLLIITTSFQMIFSICTSILEQIVLLISLQIMQAKLIIYAKEHCNPVVEPFQGRQTVIDIVSVSNKLIAIFRLQREQVNIGG